MFIANSFSKPIIRVSVLSIALAALVLVLTIQSPTPVAAKVNESSSGFQLPSFADVVEQVSPAVVNISISGKPTGSFSGPGFSFPPGSPFEEFFFRHFGHPGDTNRSQRPTRKFHAQGSGFIVSSEGMVVTNYHVVKDADEITVVMHDGEQYQAQVKGVDEKTDLALLQIEVDEELAYVEFGNSDQARVGDWVLAIGNPFGLGGSATTGIVSARGRDIRSGPLDDFLQIDAPINRGNSGGPLFNAQGEVVGVNTAIFSPNGGNVGIGFAIPSNMAKQVVAQLDENGFVERGWLGIYIQQMTEDIAESLELGSTEGALVANVIEDSPAQRSGLRPGDVVMKYDGQLVKRTRDLPRLVSATKPNSTVDIEIWRNGERLDLQVNISASNETQELASTTDGVDQKGRLGLSLQELTPEVRDQYDIDEAVAGVIIAAVEPNSPAFEKGLRRGDVIKQVGDVLIDDVPAAIKAVKQAKKTGKDNVLLLIERRGQDRFVAVKFA